MEALFSENSVFHVGDLYRIWHVSGIYQMETLLTSHESRKVAFSVVDDIEIEPVTHFIMSPRARLNDQCFVFLTPLLRK